jgi:hypothetical protein
MPTNGARILTMLQNQIGLNSCARLGGAKQIGDLNERPPPFGEIN